MSRLVFNHHSLPYNDPEEAVAAMPEFVTLCFKAQGLGLRTIVMEESLDPQWYLVDLAPGYAMRDWFQSAKGDPRQRDVIRAFLSIATSQPLFVDGESREEILGTEVREQTSGAAFDTLQAALWYNAPVASFPSRAPWTSSPIAVIKSSLTESGIIETFGAVDNLYSLGILESIRARLLAERNAAIESGESLWADRERLFPNLVFCGKSEEQIRGGITRTSLFESLKDELTAMDAFAGNWKAGKHADYSHDALRSTGLHYRVSGESTPTADNPAKRQARCFYLPDGRSAYCENHVKLPLGIRLHFYPDPKKKILYIVYIGEHLPL
jgi:hypothetical protein